MVNNKKLTSSKSNNFFKTLLKNKVVLNLSYTLFLLNILVFLFFKDIQNLCLLLIGACITYLFDKNMIIVLTVPMLFIAILIFLRKPFMKGDIIEGMEGESEESEEKIRHERRMNTLTPEDKKKRRKWLEQMTSDERNKRHEYWKTLTEDERDEKFEDNKTCWIWGKFNRTIYDDDDDDEEEIQEQEQQQSKKRKKKRRKRRRK